MLNEKKTYEIAVLDSFRVLLPDFPKGVLFPGESPDFILSLTPRTKIGIELTRLNQRVLDSNLFSFENIAACLSSKEEKLDLYKRKKLQEYWLILVVGESLDKPRFNLHNKLTKWVFESGFKRVFLFDVSRNRIYGLQTD